MFNQTEIALILMDHGANVESKNGQGRFLLLLMPIRLIILFTFVTKLQTPKCSYSRLIEIAVRSYFEHTPSQSAIPFLICPQALKKNVHCKCKAKEELVYLFDLNGKVA